MEGWNLDRRIDLEEGDAESSEARRGQNRRGRGVLPCWLLQTAVTTNGFNVVRSVARL
jgi:hypothetical protein